MRESESSIKREELFWRDGAREVLKGIGMKRRL